MAHCTGSQLNACWGMCGVQGYVFRELATLVRYIRSNMISDNLQPPSRSSTASSRSEAAHERRKLDLLNYYTCSTQQRLPEKIYCMVTGLLLPVACVQIAHLLPASKQEVSWWRCLHCALSMLVARQAD